jgi:hypothetical protein
LHNFRVNGKFAKHPALPAPERPTAEKKRHLHTNLFIPLPDAELLKLCPRKFRDLAEMLFRAPGKYGYKGHRLLLCTYLQAIENLKRLEGQMGEVFVRRDRFYGAPKVMAKLRQTRLMDLYRLCVINGIQVPFGTERGQMLEWLETRCEEGVLLLEPYSEPEEAANREEINQAAFQAPAENSQSGLAEITQTSPDGSQGQNSKHAPSFDPK